MLLLIFSVPQLAPLPPPTNVTNSLNTKRKLNGENTVALNTVKSYMDYLADAFLQELF